MARIIQKFGGTSVATPDKIKRVAQRIAATCAEGHQVAVVVSAMGHTTDELLQLLSQVTPDAEAREVDMLLTTGEQISIALVACALRDLGVKAVSLTGWQAGIHTEALHRKAQIVHIDTARMERLLADGIVPVVAGFQGITDQGEITTLGRGGSDTTAVAIAEALHADICDIFTDVEGVFTTDPRVVPEARLLSEISHEEMLELASLGAQVLHPRAVEYAMKCNVVLRVRSTFGQGPGTVVKGANQLETSNPVSGVAADLNQAKMAVLGVPDRPGVAARIFTALARSGINVDMIIQSAREEATNDIAFTVTADDLGKARRVLEEVGRELGIAGIVSDGDIAKVSIVGAGMINHPGTAAAMFAALAEADINIEMISTSEIKVSCAIRRDRAQDAVRVVHRKFGLEESKHPAPTATR